MTEMMRRKFLMSDIMKRKIISINEDKCTGCGQCIPDCPEGALQIIEKKARLVSDLFCDGLGACIGNCPVEAISVIEREAAPYDEKTVMENISRQGELVIKAHLEHLMGHGQKSLYNEAIKYLNENNIVIPDHNAPLYNTKPVHSSNSLFNTCPGSSARNITWKTSTFTSQPLEKSESELRQWPIQLRLLNPEASYFDDADLLISADCVPFSYAGFHNEFLMNRIVIIFCPKLDSDIDDYITKMAAIFKQHTIKSIMVVHMEVPCCNGVRYVVDQALEQSGKKIQVTEKTITIDGGVTNQSIDSLP